VVLASGPVQKSKVFEAFGHVRVLLAEQLNLRGECLSQQGRGLVIVSLLNQQDPEMANASTTRICSAPPSGARASATHEGRLGSSDCLNSAGFASAARGSPHQSGQPQLHVFPACGECGRGPRQGENATISPPNGTSHRPCFRPPPPAAAAIPPR